MSDRYRPMRGWDELPTSRHDWHSGCSLRECMNDVVRTAAHLLGHVATTIVGIALVVVGLGMTVTIVFATGGIIFMAVGVSLIVGGIFAHAMAGP
jgi:hypothetical protein